MSSRFDAYYINKTDSYLQENGLVEMNSLECAAEELAMSNAVSLPLLWKDTDNAEKYIKWDAELEKFLQHLAALIDYAGRDSCEPYALYQKMNLNFLDGFALNQSNRGTCCGAAHRNAHVQSTLTFANMIGGVTPTETSLSITYALARGNGRVAWGDGANLQPMAQWASKVGNYLTSDMGRYSTNGSGVTEANRQKYAANALANQSIPCYVKDLQFDTFYELARGGVSANVGSDSWPATSTIDENGMSIGQGTSTGAHATVIGGHALEIGKTRYVLWTNSHGPRYKTGTRIKQSAFSTYITKATWNLIRLNKNYGMPYINFSEMLKSIRG